MGRTSPRRLLFPAGTDVRTLKDPTGKAYGPEAYAAGQKPEGHITEVSYMFPKPGTTAPAVAKVSFVTRVGEAAASAITSRPFQNQRSLGGECCNTCSSSARQ